MVSQTLSTPSVRTHLCLHWRVLPWAGRWKAVYAIPQHGGLSGGCSLFCIGLRVMLRNAERVDCWNTSSEKGERAHQVVMATYRGTSKQSADQRMPGRTAHRTPIRNSRVATAGESNSEYSNECPYHRGTLLVPRWAALSPYRWHSRYPDDRNSTDGNLCLVMGKDGTAMLEIGRSGTA